MGANNYIPNFNVESPHIDPMGQYGKLLSLRALMQEQQLRAQQIQGEQLSNQQKQNALQQMQAMNDAYKSALTIGPDGQQTFDQGKVLKSLADANQGSLIPGQKEKFLELDKKAGEVQETRDKHNAAAMDYMGAIAKEIKDADYNPAVIGTLLAHAAANGYAQEAQQLRQRFNQDPQSIPQVVDQVYAASTKQAQAYKDKQQGEQAAAAAANDKANLPKIQAEATIAQQNAALTPQQRALAGNLPYQAAQGTPGARRAMALETQQKVIAARAEGQARLEIQKQAYGANGALANVPPHLIGPATADATKAGTEYAQAQSVTQRLQAMMEAAKKGNVVSYQLIPEEGALQMVTSQGVHRINMAEIQNYGGGSLWQRLQGHIGKQLSGKSIPKSVLDDMAELQKIQADGSRAKYENTLKTINQNYGSTFTPVQFGQGGTQAGQAAQGGKKNDPLGIR